MIIRFFGLLLCVWLLIFYPLFKRDTILFNTNHLVAFYNPWASTPHSLWGIKVHHKPVGNDDLWIFYPQRAFTQWAMTKWHEIPLWNPYSFSGNHHAGLSETAVFYPLNLIFFLMPQVHAWTLLVGFEPLFLGIGMFLYLRTIVRSFGASAFGAIVFAFCALLLVRTVEGISVEHTIIWLPFVLWSAEKFYQTKKFRYTVLECIVLVFSLTAGWFQYTFYVAVTGFFYSVFRHRSIYLPAIYAFFLFPFLALFHIVPAAVTFLESPRAMTRDIGMLELHLAPLQHLVTLLFPDFWGNPATYNYFGRMPYKEPLVSMGVIPFVLSLIGIANRKKYSVGSFFVALLGVSFFLGFDTPIARLVVHLPIPIISTFIPARILVLASLSFSVFAAFGIEEIGNIYDRQTYNGRVIVWVSFIAIALLGICFMAYEIALRSGEFFQHIQGVFQVTKIDQLKIQWRNAVIPTGFLSVFALGYFFMKTYPRILKGFIWLLTVILIVLFSRKYLPFSDDHFLYPQHPLFTFLENHVGDNRFIVAGTGHIATNIPLYYNLPSPEGAGSMYVGRYGELLSYVTDPMHRTDQVLRIESYIDPPTRRLLTGGDPVMQRFLRLDGVRYVASLANDRDAVGSTDTVETPYTRVWQEGEWQVWEDSAVLPRAFITGNFEVVNQKNILPKLFSPTVSPRKVFLEKNPGISPDGNVDGEARIAKTTANTITIDTTTKKPSVLFLSDTFTKAFHAEVDGTEVPILRANYAFRAVVVPAGIHRVRMYYWATPVIIGTLISAGIWIGGCLWCFRRSRQGRLRW